jgi:hypothetical protein
MPEFKPLTKDYREVLCRAAEAGQRFDANTLLRYEATVRERDERIAELEAENARLTPLAETGEAAKGIPPMGIGLLLSVGRWAGVYVHWGYTKRLCLGWFALTLFPCDPDALLAKLLKGGGRRCLTTRR